jgi:hypothetical protein
MSIQSLQRVAVAARRRCLLAALDQPAPAFALMCDEVIAQTD